MTLNQIEADKDMLSQVLDAESSWLQLFDDSTGRVYEDRKTANEIREAYTWDQGFGKPSATKSEDSGRYAQSENRDMDKILRLGSCTLRSMTTMSVFMTHQIPLSPSEFLPCGWVILLMHENFWGGSDPAR